MVVNCRTQLRIQPVSRPAAETTTVAIDSKNLCRHWPQVWRGGGQYPGQQPSRRAQILRIFGSWIDRGRQPMRRGRNNTPSPTPHKINDGRIYDATPSRIIDLVWLPLTRPDNLGVRECNSFRIGIRVGGSARQQGTVSRAPENLRSLCGGEPPCDVMPIRTFGFTQPGCCFAAVGSVAEARRLHRLQAKQPEGPVSW
ncbi:hypothetical protein BGZ61DRAFT_446683 [Ilyonectria robusta]|uniref:uncharacterized protein n=1 Tax=Ilyonectria robusta TaxID=1079257 RepID=UPI001E8E3CBC|nr:uncharacterized protein BGZ61DRAFT_446683 [Ilyonectria robusta]KAH8729604.1 hypothetical protein BGZ61DRAFT_446683 [Ilyonectria robusta]